VDKPRGNPVGSKVFTSHDGHALGSLVSQNHPAMTPAHAAPCALVPQGLDRLKIGSANIAPFRRCRVQSGETGGTRWGGGGGGGAARSSAGDDNRCFLEVILRQSQSQSKRDLDVGSSSV
jgi:hypothetical protein